MEFKGTQGKWKVDHLDDIFIESENGESICIIEANGVYDYNTWQENALLISKAPEMLHLLKDTLELQKKHVKSGCNTQFINIDEIEKLIKEATTI